MAGVVLLALDTALSCGVACAGPKPGIPLLRTHVFETGRRPLVFADYRRFLCREIKDRGINAIAVETPMPMAARDHGKKNTEATYRMLRGFIVIAEEVCGSFGCTFTERSIGEIKRYLTGNNFASKDAMVHMAKTLGWSPRTDDEADAGALYCLVMSELDPKFAPNSSPLFART